MNRNVEDFLLSLVSVLLIQRDYHTNLKTTCAVVSADNINYQQASKSTNIMIAGSLVEEMGESL